MTLEWIDPPRDYRDDCADIVKQLRGNPGQWARVATDFSGAVVHAGGSPIIDALEYHGIETRFVTTSGNRGTYGERGDVYARARTENRR